MKPSKPSSRRFWVQVGPIFGFGLARGDMEVLDEQGTVASETGLPRQKIGTQGMAPGSLGLLLEGGYLVLPKLLLSLQARAGYIGFFTKNVPGAAMGDFAVLARAKYFLVDFADKWLNLYAGGGLGFAMVRHAVKAQAYDGPARDTVKAMGIAPSGYAGLLIGKDPLVKGFVEIGFLMTAWGDSDLFTFHLDFSAGACLSF